MKKCPHCAEEIREVAVKCNHCGVYLDPSMRPHPGAENIRPGTCPDCGAENRETAIKCKQCGAFLDPSMRPLPAAENLPWYCRTSSIVGLVVVALLIIWVLYKLIG